MKLLMEALFLTLALCAAKFLSPIVSLWVVGEEKSMLWFLGLILLSISLSSLLILLSTTIEMFGSSYCWFEGDAKVVVNSILYPNVCSYWPIDIAVLNCCSLLDSLPLWHISHTNRSGNVCAHNVRKWCLFFDICSCSSFLELPSFLLSDVKEWQAIVFP